MQINLPRALEDAMTNYLRFVTRGDVSAERTDAHEEVLWQMRLYHIPFADRDDAREIAIRWTQTGEMMLKQPRLKHWQYNELDAQYAQTPALSDGWSASGEHYQLVHLLNQFGLHPNSREQAMELTEELLAEGYYD